MWLLNVMLGAMFSTMAISAKPMLETVRCACGRAFTRDDPDEVECFECWKTKQPPESPEVPDAPVDEKPKKCPCGLAETHEGLCSYRARHLEEKSRLHILNEMVELVRGLGWGVKEDEPIFQAGVLLCLSVKWGRNIYLLRGITHYPEQFIVQVNRNLRKNGIWTSKGVCVEWLKEGIDGGEFSVGMMLDAMVAIGEIERADREEWPPRYKIPSGGKGA